MKQVNVDTKLSAKRAKDEKDHYATRPITVPESLNQDELAKWVPVAKQEAEAKGISFDALEALIDGVFALHRADLGKRLDAKYGKRVSAAAIPADQKETF